MKSAFPNHALWIHGNLGAGVLVVDVAHAHRMSNDLSLTGRVTTPPVVDVPVDIRSAPRGLCTDVSLASYLEGNPDGLLGANARVVSPYSNSHSCGGPTGAHSGGDGGDAVRGPRALHLGRQGQNRIGEVEIERGKNDHCACEGQFR